jgi:hypothetical protein
VLGNGFHGVYVVPELDFRGGVRPVASMVDDDVDYLGGEGVAMGDAEQALDDDHVGVGRHVVFARGVGAGAVILVALGVGVVLAVHFAVRIDRDGLVVFGFIHAC